MLLSHLTCVNGRPGGPPAGSCDSMMPGHGAPAQTTASPYSLTITGGVTSYTPGQQITGIFDLLCPQDILGKGSQETQRWIKMV